MLRENRHAIKSPTAQKPPLRNLGKSRGSPHRSYRQAIVKKFKERSANSKGKLEVLQAGNDLMAYQIDETRRLRVTLMTQANAITNYLSAQNNKEILQDAKSKKMKEGKNDWEGKSDLNAIKF
nr:hypothetical protein [uncultured Campylobacter sp.]